MKKRAILIDTSRGRVAAGSAVELPRRREGDLEAPPPRDWI
jgi:hypothetical protein